jgi:hypothetical protein
MESGLLRLFLELKKIGIKEFLLKFLVVLNRCNCTGCGKATSALGHFASLQCMCNGGKITIVFHVGI